MTKKKFVVDHRQKYVEVAKDCLWIEIADEHLRFLQTKHLQCTSPLLTLLRAPCFAALKKDPNRNKDFCNT